MRKQDDLGDFDILIEGDPEAGTADEQSRARSPHAAGRPAPSASNAVARAPRAANKHARQAIAAHADEEEHVSETDAPELVKKKRLQTAQ